MPLSKAKTAMVAGVFSAAPDEALHRLEGLLAEAKTADALLEPVHALAATESKSRRVVAAIFAPILPMTAKPAPPKQPSFALRQITAAWRKVAEADPDLAYRAEVAAEGYWDEDNPPPVFDLACARAMAFADDPMLARALRLAPVLRTVRLRLPAWLRNLTGENVAALRLVFKDALELDEDCSPIFWAAVMAMLDQPWQVIRLISAVIDRPSDRYLASSELAGIGERILEDVDSRITALKGFDPNQGEEGGATAAAAIHVAVQEIVEFEEWLTLRRDGPWGARLVEQRTGLTLAVEARLNSVDPAVGAALPTQVSKSTGKSVRSSPKLVSDPQPVQIARAKGLLTLLDAIRPAAAAGGFASVRNKALEALEKRLDQYCEDLVEILHRPKDEDLCRVRAYLEAAADLTALTKGPQSAQIIRRRAAAA